MHIRDAYISAISSKAVLICWTVGLCIVLTGGARWQKADAVCTVKWPLGTSYATPSSTTYYAFFWDLWILKLEDGVAYDVPSGHLFRARHSKNIRTTNKIVVG